MTAITLDERSCAIHQPFVYAWPGYVAKALHSGCFVFMEHVQFQSRGFMRRNRIRRRNADGWGWLTVPVLNADGRLAVKDVRIDGQHWIGDHMKTLATEYGSCPFYGQTMMWLAPVIERKHVWFVDLAVDMMTATTDALGGARGPLLLSSDLGVPGGDDATGKLLWICERAGALQYVTGSTAVREGYLDGERFAAQAVDICLQNVTLEPYAQRHGGWQAGMATVDMMMNIGSVEARAWIDRNVTYEPLEERVAA